VVLAVRLAGQSIRRLFRDTAAATGQPHRSFAILRCQAASETHQWQIAARHPSLSPNVVLSAAAAVGDGNPPVRLQHVSVINIARNYEQVHPVFWVIWKMSGLRLKSHEFGVSLSAL